MLKNIDRKIKLRMKRNFEGRELRKKDIGRQRMMRRYWKGEKDEKILEGRES